MKDKIFEINKFVPAWTVGTRMDVYFDFYAFLIISKKYQKGDIINVQSLCDLYEEFKGRELAKPKVPIRQAIPQLELSQLIKEKSSDEFVICYSDFTQYNYKSKLLHKLEIGITNINSIEKVNKNIQKILFNIIIYKEYSNNNFSMEDVLNLKASKGNITNRFIKDYTNTDGTIKSDYITNMDSEVYCKIYKLFGKEQSFVIDHKPKYIVVKEPENNPYVENVVPLDKNIDGASKRDQVEQAKFREELIKEAIKNEIQGCWICGMQLTSSLDAAHIIPHSKGGSFERANGLLLCKNHHDLFDKHYIKIMTDGTVFVNNKIGSEFEVLDVKSCVLNKKVLKPERISNLKELL